MNRKINITTKSLCVILGVISLSVFTLTIAYAALSSTLSISGNTEVTGSAWDVSISNSKTHTNKITGSATYTTPTITGTTIANYSATLTKPGDSVTLYFDLNNNGTLNAEISSLINSNPTCTSETGNTADAKLVCDNLEISMDYTSSEQYYSISVGDVLNTNSSICFNDSNFEDDLDGQVTIKLIIKLKETMTSVPSSKVTISNLKHEIAFIQTDKKCTSVPGVGPAPSDW